MNAPLPSTVQSYTLADLAAAIGTHKTSVMRRAAKEGWNYDEKPHPGGAKRYYALADLPADVRKVVQAKAMNKVLQDAGSLLPATAGGVLPLASPAVPFSGDLSERQREERDARTVILAAINRLRGEASCSQEAAITTLLVNARAGKLEPVLTKMLRSAKDSRGRKGDDFPSSRTIERWLQKGKTGDLAPIVPVQDMTIKPWHGLVVALKQRPQGSCMTWIHEELEKQWDASWGNNPPSYDAVRRFLVKKFSAIDQLKGRHTGSALRAHRHYTKRTNAGMVPWQEVHADGWNTHFTAPHPITGEFVTYEVWHFHDIATRYVTPPGIDLTERFEVIARGLENCIRVGGVMAVLQTDSTRIVKNSERFKTNPATAISERAGITIVHPKEVGNSQANGIAENFNTWLDKQSRELATYQGKGMDSLTLKRVKKITAKMVKAANAGDLEERERFRREAEKQGKGLVFNSHFEAVEWINRKCEEYNDRPHRTLPKIRDQQTGRTRHQTPREALQGFIDAGWLPVVMDEASLIDLFRPHVQVRVTREAVTPYKGMRFHHPDLGHWNGKDVVVAYDIMDWRQVWVKDLQGRLICEATFSEATGHRTQTAYEAAEEKRALAQIKRKEQQIDSIAERHGMDAIEGSSNRIPEIQTIDANVLLSDAELVEVEAAQQKPSGGSVLDLAMWLYAEEEDGADAPNKAAAG